MNFPERVERIICEALLRNNRPGSVGEVWQRHQQLFTRGAADYLAGEVVNKKTSIEKSFEQKMIPLTSALSLQARGRIAELAAANYCQCEAALTRDQAISELQWIIDIAWRFPVPTEAFYNSANQIILSKTAENVEPFRQILMESIRKDNRLGDPRLRPNAPKWRNVETQASHRFLSWLARDSILFFFNTILPDNSHNQRRKDFWLKYHRAIRDFQVAVSEQDLGLLKRGFASKEMPLFSIVNHLSTSAFLMRFAGPDGDYVIAEFSETGNAAYIYEWSTFEKTNISLRTPHFDLKRHLKHSGNVKRIIHNGAWEIEARHTLIGLGIWP